MSAVPVEPPPSGAATYLNAARAIERPRGLAGGDPVDVLVVGGGVTGAGVALDAVTRGLSVAQLTAVFGRLPPPLAVGFEAGIRIGDAMRALSGTSRRRLPAMRRVSTPEARLWAPAVRTEGLRGAILSRDGQLEDDALLVVALARTAAVSRSADPHLLRSAGADRRRRTCTGRTQRRELRAAGPARSSTPP